MCLAGLPSEQSLPLVEYVNKNRLSFIVTELQLATTFLEVADAASTPVTRARNLAHARGAYAAAKDVLAVVQCSASQRADIDTSLAMIEDRLDVAARLGTVIGCE